jgi:hypothetical protein
MHVLANLGDSVQYCGNECEEFQSLFNATAVGLGWLVF